MSSTKQDSPFWFSHEQNEWDRELIKQQNLWVGLTGIVKDIRGGKVIFKRYLPQK